MSARCPAAARSSCPGCARSSSRVGITRQAGRARRQARADPAAGGDRGGRHLPPDQPAALHGGGFPAPVRRGDVGRHEQSRPAPSLSQRERERLKIGISACFMHADPARPLFTGKTLQYVEQSIAHWVMSTGALAVMIPSPTGATQRGDVTLDHYAQWLDGLVLHGGADVSPVELWRAAAAGRSGRRQDPRRIRDGPGGRLRAPRQAGVRRLPRPAAAQRRATAARCTRTSRPRCPRRCVHRDAGDLRPQLPHGGDPRRLAAGAALPGRRPGQGQQHPPPGHQGPGARLRGGGGQQRGRRDRGDPAPTRPSRTWRPCSGIPNSTGPARHHRRRGAAGGFPGGRRA